MAGPKQSRWRDVDGILLLDKPAGMSSNGALQKARRIFRARKAGHTGSLDPFATGMLAVCFGEATKVCQYLLDSGKRYRAEARLGWRTTTGDPEGDPIDEQPVPHRVREDVEQVLAGFIGEIEQVPPMYSALKHEGRRLYQLARQGQEVERKPRRVEIRELTLEAMSEQGLTINVSCSKGTYIRTLVEDIGQALGTSAHTVSLRRLAIDPFDDQPMVSLDALAEVDGAGAGVADDGLLPMDRALIGLPAVHLNSQAATAVGHGQTVDLEVSDGALRLYDPDGVFLGVGEGVSGTLKPRRLVARRA